MEKGIGKTFVHKSFPTPFQKTLTEALAVHGECLKILIKEQSKIILLVYFSVKVF